MNLDLSQPLHHNGRMSLSIPYCNGFVANVSIRHAAEVIERSDDGPLRATGDIEASWSGVPGLILRLIPSDA